MPPPLPGMLTTYHDGMALLVSPASTVHSHDAAVPESPTGVYHYRWKHICCGGGSVVVPLRPAAPMLKFVPDDVRVRVCAVLPTS